MASVLIIGGGFGGVVAAESLAQRLDPEHQITLVSRHREFTFFPALVRLAFGRCALEDVFYDLEKAMLSRRVEFVQAEVFSLDPFLHAVIAAREGREVRLPYDYLVFALGRRIAVERVPGLSLLAHHLLTVGDTLRFREAIKSFDGGQVVIGYCPESRLSVPVAVLQGEVAAANIAAEIEGRRPEARYDHRMTLVIDEGGEDSIYLHHKFWEESETIIRQGRFWGWAKQVHEKYWTRMRSLKPVA